jgi:hypothetical protein
MPLWQLLLDAVGVVLLLGLLYGITLVSRRRVLARSGGTFELSYRARSEKTRRGWVLGLGRYSGENLEWFRIFSLSPRPKETWDRADLEYASQRQPTRVEALSLYADHVVVSCRTLTGELELAMAPTSLMGFQSWLEAMPPGTRGVRPGDAPGTI